ncbi:hypothetical protein Gohar_004883 [Gossypium harknessii]|uniref:Uncharacterized protein n=1 Tax=Gossypium harknessii TaxID=34285 RepID=A0A7J9H679_9ROSI|nr:hypothetical protein [Gossypium harknessii]
MKKRVNIFAFEYLRVGYIPQSTMAHR